MDQDATPRLANPEPAEELPRVDWAGELVKALFTPPTDPQDHPPF